MRIVDFHTHTFPDAIAAKTLEKMSAASGLRYHTAGTEAALVSSMREAGIAYSVVLPVVTNPAKTAHINDFSAARNGENGVFHFGGIHPDTPDAEAELRRIRSLGLTGVKLHPVYQGVDIDDVRYLRILYAAAENDLTVVTHAGLDIGFPGVEHVSPAMLQRALRQVDGVRLVLAHMGAWKQWDAVLPLAEHKNVLLDTAFALGAMQTTPQCGYSEEYKQLNSPAQFLRILRAFGARRVLFGTDSPWNDQSEAVRAIDALPLTAEEKADVFYNNAARLLHLPIGTSSNDK